jgi:outer membrane protein TolC
MRDRAPWCFGATWLLAATALAQPPEPLDAPAERLALPEVIERVLQSHPEVAAAEARYQAATHRPGQEEALPDPMVSTGYTSAGRPWPGAGLGSDPNASLGVMVSQAIPYPGKRQLRADALRHAAEAQRQDVDVARLSLIARVKEAYYRLASTYQLDEILRRNEELLGTLVKVSESRYAVGQAAQQDVIRAQTQVSLLALQRARIARDRRTREGELNVLMNRPPDAPVGQPHDLRPFALPQTLPQLLELAAAQSPLLRRDVLMASSTEAAVDVARRDFKPDFAVSAGYNYMGSMPDMFEARFDVVIPLQRARRRAALAERQGELAADRHAAEVTRLTLQGRLQEDYQGAFTASQLAGLYRDAVLPQARLALESSISSYQTGGIEFLAVLANFGSVLEYEMSYIEQLADLHLAVLRLEEMSAATLLP